MLGLALVTGGLAAWASGRPLLAAALFGVAGYLKPPNVLMAAPLGLEPLLPPPGSPFPGPAFVRRLGESLKRALVLVVAAASLYGLNAAFTGELNYQGGERKTFYQRFPLDSDGTTFDDSGFWMTTNQLGPLVSGKDDAAVSERSGPARQRSEFREAFVLNLGYFWVGRFGGVLAYFFPALLALLLFLLRGPRDRAGWLALAAIVISWLAYLRIIPDNWYGGGRHDRQPLLPEPAARVPVPRARRTAALALPRGRGGAGRRRLPGAGVRRPAAPLAAAG